MRRINKRLVIVGGVLIVLAVGFFLVMLGMAPKSNDPAALMRVVGQVCGIVGGLAVVLIVAGLIGRKA